ncbi:MAG: hypothetical protein K2P73_13980 [Lachnospiraceae bacterium]|nr:hypothetical protein [Lachnospiraceae bacterium]
MMNPTMFDPVALENWYADDENSFLLQTEPGKYFQNYLPCFRSDPQRKLFRTAPSSSSFPAPLLWNSHSWTFTRGCSPDVTHN